jgi:hypothetical protein
VVTLYLDLTSDPPSDVGRSQPAMEDGDETSNSAIILVEYSYLRSQNNNLGLDKKS